MKNKLFTLAVLLAMSSPRAHAQSGPIEELDMGACWLQEIRMNDTKIGYRLASFGSGVAFGLYTDEASNGTMKEWVKTQLKTRFPTLPALKYEIGFHCYSSGHIVSVQIERPGSQPICINAKANASNAMNDLELTGLRPDATYSEGSVCLGIEERSLGLSLKKSDEIEVTALRNLIEASPTLSAVVESIDYRAGSFFAVAKLKEAYAFRELEAKALLEANTEVMTYVSNLWLNNMNTIEGEDRVLFKGMTDAY